jgi:hypothetical protein
MSPEFDDFALSSYSGMLCLRIQTHIHSLLRMRIIRKRNEEVIRQRRTAPLHARKTLCGINLNMWPLPKLIFLIF